MHLASGGAGNDHFEIDAIDVMWVGALCSLSFSGLNSTALASEPTFHSPSSRFDHA